MIRVAIIGTGSMAGHHAAQFSSIRGCRVVACCDIVPGRAAEFAASHGIPASYEDAEAMLTEEKIDAVSVVTSDNAHCESTLLALKHGIPVMCEKPLALNLADARRMERAARKKGLVTMVHFTYRNSYASQKAARVVASGKLGRILHVEGSYLQSWLKCDEWGHWSTTVSFLWRLSSRHGSLGCLGDIGVHLYDLASFVVGDIAELECRTVIYDKGVKKIGPYMFDANDAFFSTVRFKNGAVGTLHGSRWASGQLNSIRLRVYGESGGLDLDLDRDPERQLKVCIGQRAIDNREWKTVKCPRTPNMQQRFITSVRTGVQGQASFAEAVKVQAYLDWSMKAAETTKV